MPPQPPKQRRPHTPSRPRAAAAAARAIASSPPPRRRLAAHRPPPLLPAPPRQVTFIRDGQEKSCEIGAGDYLLDGADASRIELNASCRGALRLLLGG